jgi:hypothetical protein
LPRWERISQIRAVAKKEFLHVLNDRRILGLILFLPPIFTLLLGHAFEVGALSNVPATLLDRDQSPESKAFVERLRGASASTTATRNPLSYLPTVRTPTQRLKSREISKRP